MANTGSEGKLRNLVYVFVPFRFKDVSGVLSKAKVRCGGDDVIWEDGAKGIKSYFFKYLTDKIAPPDTGNADRRCCILLSAKEKILGWSGLRDKGDWERALAAQRAEFGFSMADVFHLYQPSYMDKTPEKMREFCLHIDSLKVALFATGIGLVAFGVVLESDNAIAIAHAEYLLKQAAEGQYGEEGQRTKRELILQREGEEGRTDFATMASKVTRSFLESEKVQFGFYSRKPRANIFSFFIASEDKDGADFEEKLFYLSNGYGVGYMYPGDGKDAEAQYLGDPNIRWGVSNEVACCVVRPDLYEPAKGFIYDSFYYKFRREYLFMYMWQLHQKYALYAFLTDISEKGLNVPDRDKAEALREYKRKFADFETSYVFARITEVPQYQRLYDAVSRQFALRTMYEDVKEPIAALEELIRDDEARAQEREQRATTRITTILAGMAFLSVFSAYIDSYDFIGKWFGSDNSNLGHGVRIGQGICIVGITIVVLSVLVYLLRCVVNTAARSGSRAGASRGITKERRS